MFNTMKVNFEKEALEIIEDKQLEFMATHFEPVTYKTQTEIIYKGHVPHVAFLICEGEVHIQKSTHAITLGPGTVLGLKELAGNLPFKYEATITSNTKVIILDKSTVKELQMNPIEHLDHIFSRYKVA